MQIGPYTLPNALFVAPMAGVTDRPFRQLCRQFGAGYAVSEMVTSRPDLQKSLKTSRRANHEGEADPVSVQIAGAELRHYPDTDELHIDGVTFLAVDESGVEVTGTARQGIATGDGERVTLIGQVHVVSPAHGLTPRMEFRGERLVAWTKAEKMRSTEPVEIWRGPDRFHAQDLDFDMKTGQYQLSGRVRGVLQPQPQ